MLVLVHSDNEKEFEFRRSLADKLGRTAGFSVRFPPEYGGGGLFARHQLVIQEEIASHGIDFGHVFYTLAAMVAPRACSTGAPTNRSRNSYRR